MAGVWDEQSRTGTDWPAIRMPTGQSSIPTDAIGGVCSRGNKRVVVRWLGSGDVPLDLMKKGVPGARVDG